jgi:UDP-GlcNAc:undecaprenyl-phosphate/decaprenyl-phosphate GlcNAc-1-phosphate transferase
MPTAVLAFALGLLLTPLLARLGRGIGLVDRPIEGDLKIHTEPKPLTGGIGIVAATLVAAGVASGIEPLVVASIVLLLAVGVVDDLIGLPPLVRLVAEVGAGALLLTDVRVALLGDLGFVVLLVAVPAAANAVNIVDGQDGLAAGLATLATFGMTAIIATEGGDADLGLALAAALVAFLVWNRPPASVFLGDGGAYAVGGLLVVLAAASSVTWESMLGSLVCMSVFILELASTMVRRAFARTSLVSGDRSHMYDLLAVRLASREQSTAAVVAAGAAAAGLGWVVAQAPLATGVGIGAGVGGVGLLAALALLRSHGRRLRRSR